MKVDTSSNETMNLTKDKLSDDEISQRSIYIKSNYQLDDSLLIGVKSLKSKKESISNCYSLTTASGFYGNRGKFGSRSGVRTAKAIN